MILTSLLASGAAPEGPGWTHVWRVVLPVNKCQHLKGLCFIHFPKGG